MLSWLHVFIKISKVRYFKISKVRYLIDKTSVSTPASPPPPSPPVKGYWSGHGHLGIQLRGSCVGNTFSMGCGGHSYMVRCYLSVELLLAVPV